MFLRWPGAAKPSFDRTLGHPFAIGIVFHINVLAHLGVGDSGAADALLGADAVGALMGEVVTQSHIVAVAARRDRQSSGKLQLHQSGFFAHLVDQFQDARFFGADAGELLLAEGQFRVEVDAAGDGDNQAQTKQQHHAPDRTALAHHFGHRHRDHFTPLLGPRSITSRS